MTVSTLHVRTDAYAGDGVSTVFPVTFQFLAPADLRVIEVSAAGVETPKSLGADYTVSGGGGGTGNVTALSAPPAGVFWVIVRQTGRDQPISWAEGGPLTAASLQRAVDKNALLVQEADNRAARGVRLPDSDPDGLTMTLPAAAARAGKAVVFAGDGGVAVGRDLYDDQAFNAAASADLSHSWAVGGPGVPAGQSAADHAAAAGSSADLSHSWAVGGPGVPAGQSAADHAAAAGSSAALSQAWAVGGEGVPAGQSAADHAGAAAEALAAMQKGQPGGVADLDGGSKLPLSQLPGHSHGIGDVAGLQTALDGKAAANLSNVANLDFAAKASAAGVGGGFIISQIVTISAATSITQASHAGKALRVTAAAVLTFPPASSFIASCLIYNQTGAPITLTSSSSVNGASSWVVLGGQSAIVVGDGTQYLATSGGPALTWMVNFTPGGISGLATLSADAMTATGGADAWRAARTAALPTTGVYFEMHVIGKGGDDGVFGVDGATYDGGTHALVAGRAFNGQIITAGGYGAATWPAASAGTVAGVAISADNKMWMSHNNSWVGSPSAGASPSWTGLPSSRAAVCRLRWTADAIRLVCAVGSMAYEPPAGFAAIQS